MKFYTNVDRNGSYILYRGYENGKAVSKKVKYQPTLYIPTKQDTKYTSFITNKPILPKKIDDMYSAKEFIEKYKDVEGFEIYGTSDYIAQYIQEQFPNKIKFDMSHINILAFDIEVDISDGYPDVNTADKAITSISLKSSKTDTYYLLGLKDYDKTKTISGIDPDNILFEKYDTEELLLKRFIQLWSNNYPDVITGWNVEYFDIMYIVTRIIRLFGEEKAKLLSPWGNIRKTTIEKFGRQQSTYNISGITIVDYMDAFKKFGYKYGPQESYKLDHIAYVVLGKKKLDYTEYGSLTELYEKNPQLYLDYNLVDTHLIQELEDESGLISLVLTLAYDSGVNYSDAFGTVGIWETILYRKLMSKNLVPKVKGSPGERLTDLVGGFVKDPIPGMYKWIVSFDLNSLYPHLIMQYNMSPETYLENIKENVSIDQILNGNYENTNEYAVAANGACFDKSKLGVIPEIVKEIYKNRKNVKIEMLKVETEIENIKKEIEKRKNV